MTGRASDGQTTLQSKHGHPTGLFSSQFKADLDSATVRELREAWERGEECLTTGQAPWASNNNSELHSINSSSGHGKKKATTAKNN